MDITQVRYPTNLSRSIATSLTNPLVSKIFKHVRIYEILLQKHCLKIFQRFQELEIQTEHYLLEWYVHLTLYPPIIVVLSPFRFLTAFTKNLPLAVTSRVWDSFLVEGEVYLYKTAVAILKLNEKFLLTSPYEDCVAGLRNVAKAVKEEDLCKAIKQIKVPEYIHTYILLANRPSTLARRYSTLSRGSIALPPASSSAQAL